MNEGIVSGSAGQKTERERELMFLRTCWRSGEPPLSTDPAVAWMSARDARGLFVRRGAMVLTMFGAIICVLIGSIFPNLVKWNIRCLPRCLHRRREASVASSAEGLVHPPTHRPSIPLPSVSDQLRYRREQRPDTMMQQNCSQRCREFWASQYRTWAYR